MKENWYQRGKIEAEKPSSISDRIVGAGIVVFSIIMILYLYSHQTQDTGFFTQSFGTFEMFILYGFWIAWIITAGLDAILDQRLLSRLFDSFGGILFIALSTMWLVYIFPFDFTKFADILPPSIKFLVEWITDGIAKIAMMIVSILLLGASIFSPIIYKFVDWKSLRKLFRAD